MLGKVISLLLLSVAIVFAAGGDLGAGTKADDLNVPAIIMFFIFRV
jgi:hypothetical protein